MQNKDLSIIIVCYNKWKFTKSCLDDLLKLSPNHEIILIDNASSDETNKEMIEIERSLQYKDKLIYVRNEENVFHSKACNQGFKISSGRNVLFLNNDIRVKSNHENWTANLITACDQNNCLVGPTMGLLDNNLHFVKEANQQLIGNCYLGGWCVAASRNIWKKFDIDGNDQIWREELPMYFNDTDIGFRSRKIKVPLKVIALPDVAHFGKISAAQINVNKLYNEGRKVFLKYWGK